MIGGVAHLYNMWLICLSDITFICSEERVENGLVYAGGWVNGSCPKDTIQEYCSGCKHSFCNSLSSISAFSVVTTFWVWSQIGISFQYQALVFPGLLFSYILKLIYELLKLFWTVRTYTNLLSD